MDDRATFLKIAYLRGLEKVAEEQAASLGLEPEMVKEAIIGKALGALGKSIFGLGKGALKWGVGKPLAYGAKAVGRQAARAGTALGKGVGREAWRLGKNLVGAGVKPGEMSRIFRVATLGGRAVPAQMLQYGALGGAIGGLTGGKPGEGWSWEGFGKGFAGGAAGGLGWAAGSRLARGGLGKVLGRFGKAGKGFRGLAEKTWGIGAKQPGFLARRAWQTGPGKGFGALWRESVPKGTGVMKGLGMTAKGLGTKAALGVPITAGALGGSILAEEAMNRAMAPDQQQPHWQAMSPQSMAARGAYAMTPGARRALY